MGSTRFNPKIRAEEPQKVRTRCPKFFQTSASLLAMTYCNECRIAFVGIPRCEGTVTRNQPSRQSPDQDFAHAWQNLGPQSLQRHLG